MVVKSPTWSRIFWLLCDSRISWFESKWTGRPQPASDCRQRIKTSKGASGEFVNRIFQDADGEHKYVVFVPQITLRIKQWPVILFLARARARVARMVECSWFPVWLRPSGCICPTIHFWSYFRNVKIRNAVCGEGGRKNPMMLIEP